MTTRRLWPRTLRVRAVVSVLIVLTVGFVAVAAATTLSLDHFLVNRLDSQLRDAGNRYSISLEHNDHDVDNGAAQFQTVEGQANGTLGARVLNGSVTAAGIVGRRGADASVDSEARETLARIPVSGGARTVRLEGLGAYRILASKGRDGDILITGLPLAPVNSTIGRLVAIELVVFLTVLVAVGVGVAIVVRRTLRPLEEIAQTAAEIARRPMGSGSVSLPERAPVERPGSEVAIVATAVNTLVDEVESALSVREASEERLRRFIADASHELRTPVAVIRGYAEVAQRIGVEQPEEVQHSLQRIVGESERIGHLVDDLLLLARLDSGLELQHEEVDLTHAVLEAVSDAQVVDRSRIWRLDLPEEPVHVTADGPGVHQVVSNLLTNARTHTPPGTSVTTHLRVLPDGDVELTVADDGPGLPPELASRAFERFVRGQDGRQTSTGSSGLGLPIVAAIVEAHGGTISLDGQHGCTVRIVFPAHHQRKGD